MTDQEDSIYAKPQSKLVDFEFNETVVRVFPDMIRRSVPGYSNLITMIGLLAQQYAQPGSNLYDLGCSLGAATLAMHRHVPHHDCRIIAVDNSDAMVTHCRENVEEDLGAIPVEVHCADIRDVEINDASLVVLNFTLQFIPPQDRSALLAKISAGLRPGGALVLSEKIAFEDPAEAALQDRLHLAFKRANGYSDLEIAQKRTALENVLIPESLDTHHSRLRQAGFSHSQTWFQCFNFASLLAVK